MEAFSDSDHVPHASLGQVLSGERERQGLSRAEVAQRLHWSPLQVEAMETGDYDRLPKGTFLRGFVRNYARLLGLDPEAALARLDHDAPKVPSPEIVVPTQNIRFDPVGAPTSPYLKAGGLVLVAAALALAAIYWWIFIRPAPPAADPPRAAPPEPSNLAAPPMPPPEAPEPRQAPKANGQAQESPGASRTESPAEPAASSVATSPATLAAASPAPAAAGGKTLRFTFAAESWVEVKDRAGRVLLQRLNPAGSTAEVSGQPPFNVVIGNAPEVRLAVDGNEFDLAPHTKVAVARFALE